MSSSLLSFDLKKLRLPAWLTLGSPANAASSSLKVDYPPVAMDLGAGTLAMARLERSKDRKWTLTAHDIVEIPPELVESDVFKVRILSTDRYRELVAGALRKEGVKTTRISLVLPDHLARVSLLPFEELPRTRRETIDMVRWRMKKAVPFKVEEAAVDYQVLPGDPAEGGRGFVLLAVLTPASIVEEHEGIFQSLGIHPGLVDLSTFSLVQLYRSVIDAEVPAGGDFMLVNVTGMFFTVMIFRDGRPLFYRCKTFTFGADEAQGEGALDATAIYRLIHREAQASIVYFTERLAGRSLARIYMRVVGHDPQRVALALKGAPADSAPELIDLSRVVQVSGRFMAVGAERSAELLQRLAPAVGAAMAGEGRAS